MQAPVFTPSLNRASLAHIQRQDGALGDLDFAVKYGLSAEEYEHILKTLGRRPNRLELGIYSVMWSEHCSYKSSRRHLKKLHTKAPWVIQGPGENAGVIDIGDGQAAIFKMESHNHPSFIEPYQGAATGVGGIMRDIFTMGARPIALMNALRMGSSEHAKTPHFLAGVVAGIGGYGNAVGVPTIGGELNFDACYNGNILVNAFCLGLADQDKIFYSAAAGIGNSVVYVGAKTGRDGIHGATMASSEFDDESASKRPTVQVGDPFVEKLLIEACLELMATDAIVAIQDMGAAGLTSSSVEMASKGGVGIHLDLEQVPMREDQMLASDMMLSESQERMLMILKPGHEAEAEAIFKKWELDFAVIGTIIETPVLRLAYEGEVIGSLPITSLADDAPLYDRPFIRPTPSPLPEKLNGPCLKETLAPYAKQADLEAALLKLVGGPDVSSRAWVYQQYDQRVMGDTLAPSGGDAGLVRVHATQKGLAVTADVTPRYCESDPFEGAKQAVAETWRNLSAVGATPLAITNCLNYGNPERPEIMGQIVAGIEGMNEAAKQLDYPVISGNVSLYNETNGQAIKPTPAIAGVGLIADIEHYACAYFSHIDERIFLLHGPEDHEKSANLSQSLFAHTILGITDGPAPRVDLALEKKNGDFIRAQITAGLVRTCHDLSDGGLAIALAEMALSDQNKQALGCRITIPGFLSAQAGGLPAALFHEGQSRYVFCLKASAETALLSAAAKAGVFCTALGQVGGDRFYIEGAFDIPLGVLKKAHRDFLPRLMGQN